jgi:transposase
LLTEPAEREPEDQALVQALGDRCAALKRSAALAREFAGLVRQRQAGAWDNGMTQVQGSGVARERSGVAEERKQDEAAVNAALSWEWSQGQFEGRINRRTRLKRPMDGRATFALLRRRFLPTG